MRGINTCLGEEGRERERDMYKFLAFEYLESIPHHHHSYITKNIQQKLLTQSFNKIAFPYLYKLFLKCLPLTVYQSFYILCSHCARSCENIRG